jgi:dienelactone hydrolase
MSRRCGTADLVLSVVCSVWMLSGLSSANALAQQVPGVKVHMHGAEGYAADGTVYTPKGEPPFAAIVLIPDERGITTRLNAAVSRFSDRGFLVVALDLNRGLAADTASHSEADAVHDLDAALSFVTAQTSVRHDAVGLMGWQSGGAYAMRFSADPRVTAVLIVDAAPPLTLTRDGKSQLPILAAFAGRDEHVTTQALQSFQVQARQLGFLLTVKLYPKADADFDNPDNVAQYRKADALDLGQRQIFFFSKYLQP